ncbi:D-alanyl-D-alanine dipeptidase [Aquiflexum balticum DSM 16537]|uniref:D-alanyl-D-alanine dipeptidase n=1 Tax=Aquiflexum balticum DSM 16537 TaxID=758820 RepID=A0A1W2GZ89_9BACT|nr:M15 family metallopeptidase [Aquiflexum balticum]SMD41953.1 D-alanyl-D-alanine dipeptidase [Aquiflexum balticum DSM 16537]
MKKYLIIFSAIAFWNCESKMNEQTVTGYDIHENEIADIGGEQFKIIHKVGDLEQSLIDAGLVDVEVIIPGVFVDLKYSTTDNFFGEDVYGELTRCYIQPVVAEMLKKSHEKLQADHPELTFLIYDGVRPQSVQQILWDNLDKPDSIKPLYVANPQVGGLHNFGVAVDLTLAHADTGEALDMGTGYDYFGYPAYPDREGQMLKEGKITEEHIANREILREVMKYGGFTGIGSEWWHFNAFSRKEAAEKFGMVK